MRIASPSLRPSAPAEPADLIKEARRRQRRRWLAAGGGRPRRHCRRNNYGRWRNRAPPQSRERARSSPSDEFGAAEGRRTAADPAQHRHQRAVVASRLRTMLRSRGGRQPEHGPDHAGPATRRLPRRLPAAAHPHRRVVCLRRERRQHHQGRSEGASPGARADVVIRPGSRRRSRLAVPLPRLRARSDPGSASSGRRESRTPADYVARGGGATGHQGYGRRAAPVGMATAIRPDAVESRPGPTDLAVLAIKRSWL